MFGGLIMVKDVSYEYDKKKVCKKVKKHYKKYDPFLLKGMEVALKRIITAVNAREKIVIYGYYDVDSITSIAILLLVLRYLNADVEYYIPNDENIERTLRSKDILNHIEFLGTDLIISLGCGMNSHKEIELCKELGIDVVVLDTEKTSVDRLDAYVINPNQDSCSYPFKGLSFVGLTFKLVQALSRYYKLKSFNKYVDLVMIGTTASEVDLSDENGIFFTEGIYQVNHTNNYGLKALMKINDLKQISEDNVNQLIECIIPRVNPIGKMDNAKIVVELLTTTDLLRAEQIAKYLHKEANKE